MRAFFGVTGHFIVNFELKRVVLSCNRFGSHTGEAILAKYREIVDKFEIEGKVDMVVTDSAKNMTKGFKLLVSDSSGAGDESCGDEDDDTDDLDIPREDFDLEVDIPTHHPLFVTYFATDCQRWTE